jgi:hypothetical protein
MAENPAPQGAGLVAMLHFGLKVRSVVRCGGCHIS